MPTAVNATTTRVNSATAAATSAAFSPVAGSVLVVITHANSQPSGAVTNVVTNTGVALTWVRAAFANFANTACDGGVFLDVAVCPTAQTNITFKSQTANNNSGTPYTSQRLYSVTGASQTSPIGGVSADTSTFNSFTTGSTQMLGDNSLLFGAGTDWNDLGTPTSADLTGNGFSSGSSTLAGFSGYKQLAVPKDSYVGVSLDAGGSAAAKWTYVVVEIRVPVLGLGEPPNNNARRANYRRLLVR